MQLLKLKPFSEFKRFTFKDPDTGYEFLAPNAKILHAHVVRYRLQNGLEMLEFLPAVIEHYLCQLPENFTSCSPYNPKRGIMGIIKGGVALLKNFYYGDENIVSKQIADKRADICVNCPLNHVPNESKLNKLIDKVAEASIGDRKSNHYEKLGECGGCGCNMRAKVFIKQNVITLTEEEKNEMKAANPNCWQIVHG